MRQITRMLVYDRNDVFLCEIDPWQVLSVPYVAEVNGEHSITIHTTQELRKTDRILLRDEMGAYHEYVVTAPGAAHADGALVMYEHYCVWSLQYDLSGTYVNDEYGCGIVPGHESVPQAAVTALECALQGTARWQVGTVTVTTRAAASFYRRNGWKALGTVVERWGGELGVTIAVDSDGVFSRSVDLLAHVGTETPTRRFDFGHDVRGITRDFGEDPWACRIVPLGKSSETEAGGYTRRPGIASVNDGVEWLQNDAVAPYVRVPDGQGGYEYPMAIVENDTYEDPADVKAWALEHLDELTTPDVTYTVDLAQHEVAGMHPHGVAEGDEILMVDKTFGDEGLRFQLRVTRIEGDLRDPSATRLTVGSPRQTLADQINAVSRQVERVGTALNVTYTTTEQYLTNLLDHINEEINALGGWFYVVPGMGTRTYDVEVSDPAEGDEASQVVETRGGTIRIANSRDQAGDWEWTSVFDGNSIASALVTAVAITAGFIGSPDGSFYLNLDNGIVQIGGESMIGTKSVDELLDETAANAASVAAISTDLETAVSDLTAAVDDARKVATNWLRYDVGIGLMLGAADSAVLNIMTNERQVFRADGIDVMYMGKSGDQWKVFAPVVQITDMLHFNSRAEGTGFFACIPRANGNLTWKWVE